MSCYTPISAYRTRNGISFHQNDDENLYEIKLPCGQCLGCRAEYARQWAIRITHEASLHEQNCFLTLTYDNDHLNKQKSLDKSDHQLFMKRLRKWCWRENKKPENIEKGIHYGKLGYFMCGEYGENKSRPHYHSCLFNFDFPDKLRIEDSRSGHAQWESKTLNEIWQMGRATIGALTPQSAAYTAGYVTKKIRGSDSAAYYGGLLPEYTACSRRPAVGLNWIKKFHSDIYNYDTCMVDGKTQRPPRYYDKFFEKEFPEKYLDIKIKRDYTQLTQNKNEQTTERLNVKHKVALKNQETYGKRNLNMGTSISTGLSDAQKNYDQKVVQYREETIGQ